MKNRELRPAAPTMCRLGLLNLLLLAALAICCNGCKPSVGGIYPGPMRNPIVTVPTSAVGGGSGTFVVDFSGGAGPYNVHYEFSGCVDPLEQANFREAPGDSLTVTFLPTQTAQSCTLTVKVVDSWGLSATSAPVGFTVQPGGDAPLPAFNSALANNASCTVTATVSDPDGDDVTISAMSPQGLGVTNSPQTVAGGNGSVTFQFYALDPLSGAGGSVILTATDGNVEYTTTAQLTCAPFTLADDSLHAVPLKPVVARDDPVRVVVVTGATANPFRYMSGVRVTFPTASGPQAVADSLNYGLPGGAADDPDGIWAAMGVTEFGPAGEPEWRFPRDLGNGRIGFNFNISPLDGIEVQTSGALFNFEVTFANAGIWTIGFQRQTGDGMSRTYYQDNSQTTDFFWGYISNEVNGEQLSVEVLP